MTMAKETLMLAPDVDGLVRWLRHVYASNQTGAIKILLAGWPMLCEADAVTVLEGWQELDNALQGRALALRPQ